VRPSERRRQQMETQGSGGYGNGDPAAAPYRSGSMDGRPGGYGGGRGGGGYREGGGGGGYRGGSGSFEREGGYGGGGDRRGGYGGAERAVLVWIGFRCTWHCLCGMCIESKHSVWPTDVSMHRCLRLLTIAAAVAHAIQVLCGAAA
jgi:hypothetical protein